MELVESLPPTDLHFQISAQVKLQIQAFFLDFSASTARLLDTFSMSAGSELQQTCHFDMLYQRGELNCQ